MRPRWHLSREGWVKLPLSPLYCSKGPFFRHSRSLHAALTILDRAPFKERK